MTPVSISISLDILDPYSTATFQHLSCPAIKRSVAIPLPDVSVSYIGNIRYLLQNSLSPRSIFPEVVDRLLYDKTVSEKFAASPAGCAEIKSHLMHGMVVYIGPVTNQSSSLLGMPPFLTEGPLSTIIRPCDTVVTKDHIAQWGISKNLFSSTDASAFFSDIDSATDFLSIPKIPLYGQGSRPKWVNLLADDVAPYRTLEILDPELCRYSHDTYLQFHQAMTLEKPSNASACASTTSTILSGVQLKFIFEWIVKPTKQQLAYHYECLASAGAIYLLEFDIPPPWYNSSENTINVDEFQRLLQSWGKDHRVGYWSVVVLKQGDAYIQPPNKTHASYSITPTISSTSQFLSWATIHHSRMGARASTIFNAPGSSIPTLLSDPYLAQLVHIVTGMVLDLATFREGEIILEPRRVFHNARTRFSIGEASHIIFQPEHHEAPLSPDPDARYGFRSQISEKLLSKARSVLVKVHHQYRVPIFPLPMGDPLLSPQASDVRIIQSHDFGMTLTREWVPIWPLNS